MEDAITLPPVRQPSRPVRYSVRSSLALELAWASYLYDDESNFPVREQLYASVPDLKERLNAFWDGKEACFTEVVILANQGGVLFEPDPGRLWAGLAQAAAAPPQPEKLASESPEDQILFQSRIERLHADPELRARWLETLQYLWAAIAPGWEAAGLAAVEGIERDLRTKLPDEGSYADLEPLMNGDWGGLMPRLVAESASSGVEVTVIPAWVGRRGLILSLFDRLVIGPPTPACLPGPSAGTRNRARRLKALGDPTRLAIFESVAGRSLPVGELARSMNVAQPTVSNHVRILRDAGLIRPAPGEGRRLEADLESFEDLLEECRRAAAKSC